MNTHILLIEADIHLAHLLELNLHHATDDDITSVPASHHCYSLTVAHNGMDGLIHIRESQPDLILLGINLPDFSGLDICRRLRATGIRVPLILMGTRDQRRDCVAGLDAGADDYLFKPFAVEELRARMRSRLRRVCLEAESNHLQFADLTLNRVTREVHRHKKVIELTSKEFSLLEYLMTHPRQVMTRNQILDHVWNDNPTIDSNILDVYIRYLRLKLEQHHQPRLLHTVRGIGYVLRDSLLKQAPVMQPARVAA